MTLHLSVIPIEPAPPTRFAAFENARQATLIAAARIAPRLTDAEARDIVRETANALTQIFGLGVSL
jgi:hypothetical protein